MTTHKEALTLALEALEDSHQNINPERSYADELRNQIFGAIIAIKEALAQPEQEPVAWRVSYPDEPELGFWFAEGIGGEGCLNEPLYTTPPQRTWVGLTYEEIDDIWRTHLHRDSRVQAIEAKLKEKNA